MFTFLALGKSPINQFILVEKDKYLLNVPDLGSTTHFVVFLNGTSLLHEDMLAAIFFKWPKQLSWQYLGYLSNGKPSALYKTIGTKEAVAKEVVIFGLPNQFVNSTTTQIGIVLRHSCSVRQLTPSADATIYGENLKFLKKMLGDFYKAVCGSTINARRLSPTNNELYVPLNIMPIWFMKIQKLLEENPNYWKE